MNNKSETMKLRKIKKNKVENTFKPRLTMKVNSKNRNNIKDRRTMGIE